MRWSKLKKLVEDTFADSVRGRVHIYSTRYRCACGRAWFTLDGKELVDLSTIVSGLIYRCIYHEATNTDYAKHPAVSDETRRPGKLIEPGEFSRFDLHGACWEYVHSNINDSLKSANPLIVSLVVLNSKVGKGRLGKLAKRELQPLTRALLEFRVAAETAPNSPHASSR
jgi:hypothetical protein